MLQLYGGAGAGELSNQARLWAPAGSAAGAAGAAQPARKGLAKRSGVSTHSLFSD